MLNENDYKLITDYIYKNFGINLNYYRDTQMKRRINNFILKNKANGVKDFIGLLETSKELKEDFKNMLTINVTEFFRNKELFKELEIHIKDITKNKKELKIWSAACSIGAEPYSIAIMLNELKLPTKYIIIATDIDEEALNNAKKGLYIEDYIKNIDRNLIDKYFIKKNNLYEISSEIKSKVIFKKHDLLKDEYENNFDIIVCRNVVIYFTQDAKNMIYSKFYKSLNKEGILFVGATEFIHNYKEIGYEKLSSFFYKKI